MEAPIWIPLVVELAMAAGGKAIVKGLRALKEYAGRARFDGIYAGAEDFWYKGIEHDGLTDGAKVRVSGLLSPFAPYMPSNPRAKPGYSTQGWSDFSRQLADFLRTKQDSSPKDPLSASSYDVLDALVWGDLVYRSKVVLAGKKLYAGLYNQYGKSFECVPVFLDENDTKQWSSLNKIGWPNAPGALVEVAGS